MTSRQKFLAGAGAGLALVGGVVVFYPPIDVLEVLLYAAVMGGLYYVGRKLWAD